MNLMLDIDDEIVAKVSKIAAAQDTTVEAMVAEYLTAMVDDTATVRKANASELSIEPGHGARTGRESIYMREGIFNMGTFSTTIEIGNLNGERYETMEALADTGATTTVVPRSILVELGILPTRQETFEYAGGERVELDMAQAWARVEGRDTYTWVIFGEDGVAPILGAYTLEGVFLAVDSYNQRLIPVVGSLK